MPPPVSVLVQRQWLFEDCYRQWTAYIHERGWRLTQGEGRIMPLGPSGTKGRRARLVTEVVNGRPKFGGIVHVKDLVHMDGGTHGDGLSRDCNLWVPDKNNDHPDRLPSDPNGWRFIRKGGTEEWAEAGGLWKSLNPLCRWGGDFTSRDDNHISILSPSGKM